MQDILKFHTANPLIALEQASQAVCDLKLNTLKDQFLTGVPMQVLMGFSEFYHHQFFVNSHVLIPRPETEYLVDLLVQQFKNKVNKVLDVGTGSGVILLSLLKAGVGKTGVGVDISAAALEVAGINSCRLRLADQLSLLESDLLSKVEGQFDLIVSNPPYIKASSHKKLVHTSVDKHEPHQALYLPDETYTQWFEEFFGQVRSHLHGTFMMEGHELEVEEQARMLEGLGFQEVKVINDLTGAKRFLKAVFLN